MGKKKGQDLRSEAMTKAAVADLVPMLATLTAHTLYNDPSYRMACQAILDTFGKSVFQDVVLGSVLLLYNDGMLNVGREPKSADLREVDGELDRIVGKVWETGEGGGEGSVDKATDNKQEEGK